eukprot:3750664-Pleurochrysis_carterae.AAC.1
MMVHGSTLGRAALSSPHSSSLSSSPSSLSAEGCGSRRMARAAAAAGGGAGAVSPVGAVTATGGGRKLPVGTPEMMRGFDAAARDLEGDVGTLLALASGMTGTLSWTLARLAAVFSSGWDKGASQRFSRSSCMRPGVQSKRLLSLPA